jgi:hypothetical protein
LLFSARWKGAKDDSQKIIKLAELYNAKADRLIIEYLSDIVSYELKDEAFAIEALRVAEIKVEYLRSQNK